VGKGITETAQINVSVTLQILKGRFQGPRRGIDQQHKNKTRELNYRKNGADWVGFR